MFFLSAGHNEEDEMNATATVTVKIEDMKIGRRYMTCRAGYEAGWTVEQIETVTTETGTAYNVIYGNGNGVGWHAAGTEIAIFCDEDGE